MIAAGQLRQLGRAYDRAIRAEENAATLPQAWRLAAVSDLCLRRLRAAQAGLPLPAPRPAPQTRANRARAALATLGAIGAAIARAVRAAAALAKAQAVCTARRAAVVARRALRHAVQFVARSILRAINHQTSPRGQGATTMTDAITGWYTIIDRDTGERFSTTRYEARDAAERERNRLALKYGKEVCLGIGQETAGMVDCDVTDDVVETRGTIEAYDVLQISRDAGATWLDFSTLRDESDFALARRYVADPRAWASQEGANGWNYRFRVARHGVEVAL